MRTHDQVLTTSAGGIPGEMGEGDRTRVFVVLAPVFLPLFMGLHETWSSRRQITFSGVMGGPRSSFRRAAQTGIFEPLYYTHDLEAGWAAEKVSSADIRFYRELLGTQKLNDLVIADRHIGSGFVTGALLPASPLLRATRGRSETAEQYVIGMLKFVHKLLIDMKPDLVVSYSVAGAFTLGIFFIAEALGIPRRRLASTRVADRFVFDESPADGMTPVRSAYAAGKIPRQSMEWARQYLNDFRNVPEEPGYQTFQRSAFARRFRPAQLLKRLGKILYYSVSRSRDTFHVDYAAALRYEMLADLRARGTSRTACFEQPGFPLPSSYFYFPLHVDPEASTMVCAPRQTNQIAAIEAIAKSIPFGSKVVVKEHLTMLGRRPPTFYQQLSRMPRVVLASPFDDSFRLIREADAVVVITGTAGLEALFLRKPVVILGKFLYDFLGAGFVRCSDSNKMTDVLTASQDIHPAEDEDLIRLIAAIHVTSFPFDSGAAWSGRGASDDGIRLMVDALEGCL